MINCWFLICNTETAWNFFIFVLISSTSRPSTPIKLHRVTSFAIRPAGFMQNIQNGTLILRTCRSINKFSLADMNMFQTGQRSKPGQVTPLVLNFLLRWFNVNHRGST